MPEEMKTAQTTADADVGSYADTDTPQENVNEVEFTDAPGEPDSGAAAKEPGTLQTKEQNSENARRRREAERQAEIKRVEAAVREQTIIETLGGKNPYTGEEMKDHADVEEYLAMREIAKNGGDPLSDFSKFQKQKEREKAEQATKDAAEKEWYRKDKEDFAAKHPEVNLQTLIQDPQFQKFASGKVGVLPLSEIYNGFIEVVSEYEKKAKAMAKQMIANQKASPGSLSSTNPTDNGFFTKEQVQKMSPEEVHANYDKIRASMRKWK